MKLTQILLTALVAVHFTAALPIAFGQLVESQSYTVAIRPGSNLIANQLGAHPDDTLSTILKNVPEGSQLLKWDETSQTFHADLFDSVAGGWVDGADRSPSTTTLLPGEAAFLSNPLPTSYDLTFAGEPNSAPETFPTMQPNVYYFRSRQTNGPGAWETITGRAPEDGAVLVRWDADAQSYQTNHFAAGRWNPSEPVVDVGEGAIVALAAPLCICFPPTPTFLGCPSYAVCSAGTTNFNYSIPALLPNGCPTTISCSPPPGAPFPVGTTTVTCTAITSWINASGQCQFTVTVTGSEPGPPAVLECPPKIRIYAQTAPANIFYQPTATGNIGPVVCVPPSGSAFPFGTQQVTCYATNACGLIASCSFPVAVRPLPKWVLESTPVALDPGVIVLNANGLLQWPIGNASLTREPMFELPGIGSVGPGPVTRLLASPDQKNAGVNYFVGGASEFRFTTVLDMEAPDGATIEVFDLEDGERPAVTLTLNRGTSAWELKYGNGGIDATRSIRSSAVNPRGELLGSFLQSLPEDATNTMLALFPEAGLTKFPVTLVLERSSGSLHVSFPGEIVSAAERGTRSTGWDGLIKARPAEAPISWDGTINGRPRDGSRVSFMSTPPRPATNSVVRIIATGLADLPILAEGISAFDRPVQAAPDVASLHRGTPDADGLAFSADEDSSGPGLDLGYSGSISLAFGVVDASALRDGQGMGFHLLGAGSPTAPDLKTILKFNLASSSIGVVATADFQPLNAVGVILEFYDHDKLVATERFDGPVIPETHPLLLDRWPETFAVLNTNGMLRLSSATSMKFGCCTGDELRVIPVLPPEAALPAAFVRLMVNASEGVEAVLRDLTRAGAFPPPVLQTMRSSAGIGIAWPGAGYRLLSAETLSGPWIDLGLSGRATLQPVGDARYFRLMSE
ncbi:MAG TPA: HYR domain-containing protein [Verrucomicrobiae bacterium]|nr:HYR domain-containing protein [Verrucomicrobiae bacterium]